MKKLLEKYIAVLPFPEVKYSLAVKLGKEYLNKRQYYRECYFLSSENYPKGKEIYDIVEEEIVKGILIDMHGAILNSDLKKNIFFNYASFYYISNY